MNTLFDKGLLKNPSVKNIIKQLHVADNKFPTRRASIESLPFDFLGGNIRASMHYEIHNGLHIPVAIEIVLGRKIDIMAIAEELSHSSLVAELKKTTFQRNFMLVEDESIRMELEYSMTGMRGWFNIYKV